MKKLIGLFTVIFMLCAALSAAVLTAAADSAADGELFMPGSYEQYLELEAPSDFAVSDKYIAIADKKNGNTAAIYLYDKTKKEYASYSFSTQNTVSSLNFYSCEQGDYLFFLETGNTVNYIALDTLTEHVKVTEIQASTLVISGNDIYYAIQTDTNSNVYHTTIKNLVISDSPDTIQSNLETKIKPSFSIYRDNVYFSANKDIYLCSSASLSLKYTTIDSVNYFTIFGENNYDIVYSNMGGLIYAGNNTESELYITGTCVKYDDGYVYLLTEHGISRYSLDKEHRTLTFDEYEIGKNSSSSNRVDSATDISVYDDKLVIADGGNKRVSVWNGNAFTSVTPATAPELVCAGEQSYLVVSGSKAYLYGYDNELIHTVDTVEGNILSIGYAFGTFYALSNAGGNSYAIDGATGEIARQGTPKIANPVSIAADIYGNVYVLSANGQVDAYNQDQFFAENTGDSTKITALDSSCKKLLVDYAGRLYGLSDTAIYEYSDGATVRHDIDFTAYIYSETEKTALSFAFGLTEESVYVLSDGFIVKTQIGISTFNNIAAEDLYASVYENTPSALNLIVNVKAGSVAVTLDFAALKSDSPYLPYLSCERLEQDMTGIVLGKTDAGYVVLFYEYTPAQASDQLPTREYTVCLISEKSNQAPEAVENYYGESSKIGYVSGDVYLYCRPAMQAFTRTERLERGSEVVIFGKISLTENELDSDYYFIKTADGSIGFIPASFVTDTDINALQNESYRYQTLKKGKSVTLYSESGESITLESKERLKVYDAEASKEKYSVVSYEKDGVIYYGEVADASLSAASSIVLVTLFIVLLVTATVILSMCYLLFRKKPDLEQ